MTNTKFGWSLDSLFPFIYFFLAGIVYNSVVFFPNQFGKRRKKTLRPVEKYLGRL